MLIEDFDYYLPEHLIAKYPAQKRDESRLLVINRKDKSIIRRQFYDIADYLRPGDCLVLNDSKVIEARLKGEKIETGASVEIFLSKKRGENIWEVLAKPAKRLKPGDKVKIKGTDLFLIIKDILEDGQRLVEFTYSGNFFEHVKKAGRIPLPPYIKRDDEEMDRQRYQTVYCDKEGSVAAPTAGLHFTNELLQKVKEKGVNIAKISLNIGLGTFMPVKCDKVEDHKMHFEEYIITESAADMINRTKTEGKRIISVGTTSARTLESAADDNGIVIAGSNDTNIYIYPPYKFKVCDCLITNFHLPKSTLLLMVSAFYNREDILKAYKFAVENEFRFFSYGDAMIII